MSNFEKSNSKYEVGYKKPPKSSQFKKGQSGNPKGRPKLQQSIEEDLSDELKETIVTKEHGEEKVITKQRAIIKLLINSTLNGKVSLFRILVQMLKEHTIKEPKCSNTVEDDRKIIEEFLQKEMQNDKYR